jgi:photosynthetic reaction center H subunit
MLRLSLSNYIDVAQVALYMFWLFLAGLILYLHREGKREGYPLDDESRRRGPIVGFPGMPQPKTFHLLHGGTQTAPRAEKDARPLQATPVALWPGAPLVPLGDPMKAGVGPGAWAERADVPDLTADGKDRVVPLRVASNFHIEARDPNPIGMNVLGADGTVGGTVTDVWVDRSESMIRYLEVRLAASSNAAGDASAAPTVLLPMNFARVSTSPRAVRVRSILGAQFADVPTLRNPDRVTRLEEERVCAYYGAGTLYATAKRAEPLL